MSREVIISAGSGFCMGVKKAFYSTIDFAAKHSNSCLYGSIVHNRFAVARLESEGIETIDRLEDILANPKIRRVIIRAHGVAPGVEKKITSAGKEVYDLTCPIVKQVQLLARTLSSEGRHLIIFGKKGHPEVLGIEGYCEGPHYVVSSIEEALALPLSELKSPALLSQTTMNSDTFDQLCTELKVKLPDLDIHNTLCRSPVKTQESAVELAQRVDLMVIVGDKSSSNTKTLYEKVSQYCPALFAESTGDIDVEQARGAALIGLAGGASTPAFQLETVAAFLKEL